MPRLLLVDDSHSVREVLASRLAMHGYQVSCANDGIMAAEMALSSPPDVIVTDLWMPGVSGVQLCRLIRSEPRTSHVPVVLITGESQRRSRFWARSAGAAAYVAKNDPAALVQTLADLAKRYPPRPIESVRPASRTPMQHRLFQRLDAVLFETTIAGEVRALANAEGEADSVFSGLVKLSSEVATYRWLALHVVGAQRTFIHAHPQDSEVCEVEARAVLRLPPGAEVTTLVDERAVVGRQSTAITAAIVSGGAVVGKIAMGPNDRGASRDDQELLSIISAELAGPLRIVALVEQARRLAMSDPLTGLLNRRAFLDSMRGWVAHHERYEQPVSLLLLDVDHFKRVNDTYGHEAGDTVLRAIAGILPTVTRQSDVIARWGGEEFVIGLPQTGTIGARVAAERIRRAIAGLALTAPSGEKLSVTASVGVACLSVGESLDGLVSRSDEAMYAAKARGRNRIEVHSSDASEPAIVRASLAPVHTTQQ
jgi:two-component system, cell cycle response regulator